ncbi:MAG: hypothetical protein JO044_01300 [Mycobacteriaceae bacterium]|nr:hypothetical protein [Mycobacteriaceae bacterium]MBV9638141.1 hypothetical protein [Mycobacteriaceae bacterium]
MKLARPDVFHPRVVLAGCPALVAGDGDDDGLVGALRRRGLFADWLSWDDPGTARADAVILRATRDRAERLDAFLTWTTTVRHLLNSPAVVAWNGDRRYLVDLARRGVPIVPDRPDVPGRPVERDARTALVFLAGKASHAFTAAAAAEPDFELWDVGFAALHAAAGRLGISAAELLYARVDVIGGIDDPRLLELDLIDPPLGWHRLDAGTRERQLRQFALEVESALDRLGLGPLSHRRP